jgi:hypothetical protein
VTTFILDASPTFPPGSTVKAYPFYDQTPLNAEPVGTVAATATVASAGTATFTGLGDNTPYWAAASVSGVWRWKGFRTPVAGAAGTAESDPIASAALTTHAADTTAHNLTAQLAAKENTGVAVAKSLVDAKGDLLTATADNTPARLGVGADGAVLTAASGQATGLQWATASAGIAPSLVDAKGDLLVGTADNTVARQAVGTDGQVLTADSAQTSGLKWGSSSSATWVVLTSDVSNSTTTLADVTGMSFSVTANKAYWFEMDVLATSASTTAAPQIAVNGPASPTLLYYEIQGFIILDTYQASATTVPSYVAATAYDTVWAQQTAPSTIGLPLYIRVRGSINNGANAGTVILRLRSETAATAVTVKTNSVVRWKQLN